MPSLGRDFQLPQCDFAEIPEQPRPTCTISGISFSELNMTHDMCSSNSPSSAPASTSQEFMAALRHAIREDVSMIIQQEFGALRIWLEKWQVQHPRMAHEKGWQAFPSSHSSLGLHPPTPTFSSRLEREKVWQAFPSNHSNHSSLNVHPPTPTSSSRTGRSGSALEQVIGSLRPHVNRTTSSSAIDLRFSSASQRFSNSSVETSYRQPSNEPLSVSQFDTMMEPNFDLGWCPVSTSTTLIPMPEENAAGSSEVDLHQVFDAAYDGDLEQVRRFLDLRGDPNVQLPLFEGRRRFTDSSLLPVASMSGNVDIVHLLVDRKADVDSKYGFPAGARGFPFIGKSTDAALSKGDLELLKVLFFYKADPYASSSNGATLVWQSCYFGHLHILAYLLGVSDPGLSPPVSHSTSAESQDIEGVSLSPLHIATLQGHIGHVEMLLKERADPNVMNENNRTPLIDAIACCRPEVLRILISYGADLVNPDSLEFLFKGRNPVLVHAAALGLQQQARQVQMLSTDDVSNFLKIGNSDARRGLFEAIIRERSLVCRGTNQESVSLATALLQKSEMITGEQTVDFMNVVESSITSSDLLSLFFQRQQPTLEVKMFLDKLLPGRDQEKRHWCTNIHLTSIRVFESIVPEFHKDLRILRVIKNSSSFDPILETLPVRAIIQVNWQSHVRGCVYLQVALTCCLLLVFILVVGVLISCHGYTSVKHCVAHPQSHNMTQQSQHSGTEYNRCGTHSNSWLRAIVVKLAYVGLFIMATEAFELALQFQKKLKHGWLLDYYWYDIGKLGTLMRVVMISFTFVNICFFDFEQLFCFNGQIMLSICCFLTWVDLLTKMTPFRSVGFFVTPILFTMWDIIAFVLILLFFLSGFAHAFIILVFTEDDIMVSRIRKVFMFGMDSEFTPDEAKQPAIQTMLQREIVRWIFLISVFLMPIALMNTFIAAMVSSYTLGRENNERLYQGRLAGCVFDKMSVYLSLRAFFVRCHRFRTEGTLVRVDSISRSSTCGSSNTFKSGSREAIGSTSTDGFDAEFLWYCFERKD